MNETRKAELRKMQKRDDGLAMIAGLHEALNENEQLESKVAELRSMLSVTSSFCEIRKCRKCGGHYPAGYVCECGEDNSA